MYKIISKIALFHIRRSRTKEFRRYS